MAIFSRVSATDVRAIFPHVSEAEALPARTCLDCAGPVPAKWKAQRCPICVGKMGGRGRHLGQPKPPATLSPRTAETPALLTNLGPLGSATADELIVMARCAAELRRLPMPSRTRAVEWLRAHFQESD